MKTEAQIRDTATAALRRTALGLVQRTALHKVLGKRAETELVDHFRKRPANKRGWSSQGFWNRIATVTQFASADESGARVIISDPAFNQKYYGGTIVPKEGKYLALPAIAAAYGRSPKSLNNLVPLIRYIGGQRRAVALVDAPSTAISVGKRRKTGELFIRKRGDNPGGTVWYWLVKSVTQQPDPDALPSDATMQAALDEETSDFFTRLEAQP